jgi:hypothetical protein
LEFEIDAKSNLEWGDVIIDFALGENKVNLVFGDVIDDFDFGEMGSE